VAIYLETRARRVAEAIAGMREQGRDLALAYMANSHGDRAKEGRRSDRKHSANSLLETVDSCVSLRASIVVGGVGVSGVLRGSTDVSIGAKKDIQQQKLVGVNPRGTLGRYSKGLMPRVKRGGFVLQRASKLARV